MIKKTLGIIFICVLALLSGLFLYACGTDDSSKERTLSLDMLQISTDTLHYNMGRPVEYASYEIKLDYKVNEDGREKTYYFRSGDHFTVTYENNIDVGTATATVTMLENQAGLTGSVSFNFTIVPYGRGLVDTLDDLKSELAKHNYETAVMCGNSNYTPVVIEQDDELVVPEGMTLAFETGHTDVYNYGTITVNGKWRNGSSNTYCNFYNFGTISLLSSESTSYNDGAIYNSGTITCVKEFGNRGAIYTDSQINHIDMNNNSRYVLRTLLSDCTLSLSQDTMEFVKDQNKPTIKVNGSGINNLKYEYINNDKPGTAQVKVSVEIFDRQYGGAATLDYTITKGRITCSNFDEFLEYKNSGCYFEYTCNSTLAVTQDITILADEKITAPFLTIASNANIVNNGILTVSGVSTIDGNITNNNSFTIGKISGAGNITTSVNSQTSINGLTNTYTGKITNYGILNVHIFSYFCNNFENHGTATFLGFDIMQGKTLTNSGTLTLNNSNAKCNFSDANIINTGTINNSTTIALDNRNSTFENVQNGIVNTNGLIYVFVPLENLTENVVVRKNLQDCNFELKDSTGNFDETTYSYPYDATSHKPSLYIDNILFEDSSRKPGYVYIEGINNINCTNIGRIEVRLTIQESDIYFEYYGTNAKTYTIEATTAVINSSDQFTRMLYYDSNWLGYILETDISATVQATVYEHQTLDLNGHHITLLSSSTLTCYGKIIVENISTDWTVSKCGISLKSSAKIELYGELENQSAIYVSASSAKILQHEDGIITGNGKIYTYKGSDEIQSNTNTIYQRIIANQATEEELYLSSTQLTYNHQNQTPSITAKYDQTTLVTNDHFNVVYNNNDDCIARGIYYVSISTKNDFDEYYTGSTTKSFEIISHIFEITSQSLWTQETFNLSTYDRFDLCADFASTTDITLRNDTILNFGTHRITNIKNGNYTIYANSTNEIWLTVINDSSTYYSDFNNYKYVATKLVLGINLTNQMVFDYADEMENNMKISGTDWYSLTVDLNGHTIPHMSIQNGSTHTVNITITNSSTTEGCIAPSTSTTTICALQIFKTIGTTNLNLIGNNKNLRICGIEVGGNGSGQSNINVVAKNCKIDTSNCGVEYGLYVTKSAIDSVVSFSNCDFKAPYAIYLEGGKSTNTHKFTNCTIQSTGAYNYDKGNAVTINTTTTIGSTNNNYINASFLLCTLKSTNGNGFYVSYQIQNGYKCKITISMISYVVKLQQKTSSSGNTDMYYNN